MVTLKIKDIVKKAKAEIDNTGRAIAPPGTTDETNGADRWYTSIHAERDRLTEEIELNKQRADYLRGYLEAKAKRNHNLVQEANTANVGNYVEHENIIGFSYPQSKENKPVPVASRDVLVEQSEKIITSININHESTTRKPSLSPGPRVDHDELSGHDSVHNRSEQLDLVGNLAEPQHQSYNSERNPTNDMMVRVQCSDHSLKISTESMNNRGRKMSSSAGHLAITENETDVTFNSCQDSTPNNETSCVQFGLEKKKLGRKKDNTQRSVRFSVEVKSSRARPLRRRFHIRPVSAPAQSSKPRHAK